MGIDIDNLPYDPTQFDPYNEPEEFFEWLCGTISEDLEDVTVVYQFSTGAGIAEEGKRHNVIKVHLWFWLDKPYTCAEIKRWAQGINSSFEANLPAKPGEKNVALIDTTPMQPVGILYTADPVIGEGVSTAVVRRLGIVDLGKESATLRIPEGRRGAIAINSPLMRGRPVNAGLDLEDRLAMIGDGTGMMGFHPGFVSTVGYYFGKHGSGADRDYIKSRIIEAALSREDDRPPGEVRQRLERLDDIIDNLQGSQEFKEATGAWVKQDDEEEIRRTDLSTPFYPYPDIPNPIEGTAHQKRVIGAWFAEAVKRAAVRKIVSETGIEPDITIDETVPARLQITGPVGSGKTSAVEAIIRDSAEVVMRELEDEAPELSLNIFFASGLTDKAAETADEIPGAIVLRGAGSPDPNVNGKTMCWRPDMAQKVQAAQGVLSSVCQKCPFQYKCGYRSQAAEVREIEGTPGIRVFTGPHEFLHYPSQVKGGWDLVIVDERYKAEGAKSAKGVSIIAAPLDWSGFVYVPDDKDPDPESLVDDRGRLKIDIEPEFVDAARRSIRKAIKGNEHRILGAIRDIPIEGRLERVNLTTLRRCRDFFRRTFEATKPFSAGAPDFEPGALDEEIIEYIEDNTDPRLSFLERFFDSLVAEYEAPREQSNTVRIEGNKVVLRGIKTPTKVGKGTPILLLDATAKLHLNRKIWGDDLSEVRINIESRVSATQLIRKSWTKKSFVHERSGTWKLDDIAAVINRYPNSFVAAPKAVREALEPKLGNTILTGHYANLRGLNAFSDCKTGFVVCDPMVPPGAVLDLALAYGAGDEQAYYLPSYVDEERRFRMRDRDRVVTARCKVADNPALEMYREILVDDEMLQAIGRVRGFWNERTVYILSNRPYDQTLEDVVYWDTFAYGDKGSLALAERSPNFVVDSPSWVVERFPELTKTRSVASTMLADLRERGWSPAGWRATKDGRNVFDLLAPSGQQSLIGPGNAELGEGWSFCREDEDLLSDDQKWSQALMLEIMSRRWISAKPDWIVGELEGNFGSERSIAARIKMARVQLAAYNKYILGGQSDPCSFNFSMNPKVSGIGGPGSIFGGFTYRLPNARRDSQGFWFGTSFAEIKPKIENEIGDVQFIYEDDLNADATSQAEADYERGRQIAAITDVAPDRPSQVGAFIGDAVRELFPSSVSLEEAIRLKAEREAEREAKRERDEYEADMVEEAIESESAEERARDAFDLTKAGRQK